MTSQVLVSSSASASGASSATESHSSDALQTTGASPDMKTAVLEPAKKLPYQADHQVELLNLQAETECLLQQLTILKQQRLVVMTGSTVEDSPTHN
jgi:hypothetical protein